MIDGAALERCGFFCCSGAWFGGAAAAACGDSLLLLENMSTCLDKIARIADDFVVPDLVVHVRPRAAPGRSEFSDRRPLCDLSADPDQDRCEMTVTRMNSETMVNFDQIAVSAADSGPDHRPRRSRSYRCTVGSGEIESGMKRIAAS